jgi:hypothetical protein
MNPRAGEGANGGLGPLVVIAPVSSRGPLAGLISGRERQGAELLAEISDEGIEEYIFDRELVALIAIQLAPSFGLADVGPVGRTVTGSAESVSFDKGFQEDRSAGVSSLPIGGESLRNGA